MLIALGCVTLLALALLAFAYAQQKAHQEAQAQWAVERRELCNRIQAPERLPVDAQAEAFVIPERDPDEWAQVGSVVIDEKYGLEDDE